MSLRPRKSTRAQVSFLLAVMLGFVAPSLREVQWDFEADEPGQIADGFSTAEGRWEVVKDGPNHVLAQRAENRLEVLNLTLIDGSSYKDVDISVRMKTGAGENESGGGIVWRAKDKDNYYVARYRPLVSRHNPQQPSFCIYKIENGKRTQLDHAMAPRDESAGPPGETPLGTEWHTLRITMHGREIAGYLDGRQLLQAEDATFQDVGRVGLWTKSDARPQFDDLRVAMYQSEESGR